MAIADVRNSDENKLGSLYSSSTAQSTQQVRDEVRNALSPIKAKGVKDWEILNIWSEIAHKQGNYAAADTLASAAYELGKPGE